MSTAEATTTFDETTKTLGDKIVSLTLLQAKSLADYLEQVHGIKPASGGVMMAGPVGGAGPAAPVEEKTEFDVVLSAYARGFMNVKVVGHINVALIFGLLQFVSTFLIAWAYTRWADRRFDPFADKIRDEFEGSDRA